MTRTIFTLLMASLILLAGSTIAFTGIITSEECSQDCRSGYRQCKKTETADSAVNNISCAEVLEMCLLRCRNITNYVSCKDKCGNDAACLEGCKDEFSGNVGDYRPILNK